MDTQKNISVRKSSGELVAFEPEKLARSLVNVGAKHHIIDMIIRAVELELYNGISTRLIYKKTFSLLKKYSKGSEVRYRLKEALSQLGNTGYPFERFVGDLFVEKGYDVQVGVFVNGYSVNHEIDVLAQNPTRIFTIECKYHVNPSSKSDVKVPMYILSRYTDVTKGWLKDGLNQDKQHEQWIATNTRFTDDAIKFAEGYNLNILSWDYPQGQGLKDWIQMYGAYPVTCLSCLSKSEKELLVNRGLVGCRTIYNNMHLLDRLPIQQTKKQALKKELKYLYENLLGESSTKEEAPKISL